MADLMSKKSFVDSNISISAQSLPNLTDGQKACLRLVVQHHTSKEIARILGISPFTVDQRLDAARRKLNAASRKDAAKMFASLEAETISEPLVYQALGLEPVHLPATEGLSEGGLGQGSTKGSAKIFSFGSFPSTGGERHERSSRQNSFNALSVVFSSLVIAFFVVMLASAY